VLSLEEAAGLAPEQVVGLSQELAAARHQLEWFKRQLFGHKSERRLLESNLAQLNLGELIDQGHGQAPQQQRVVGAHTRSVVSGVENAP
jgi:hypothetical protein